MAELESSRARLQKILDFLERFRRLPADQAIRYDPKGLFEFFPSEILAAAIKSSEEYEEEGDYRRAAGVCVSGPLHWVVETHVNDLPGELEQEVFRHLALGNDGIAQASDALLAWFMRHQRVSKMFAGLDEVTEVLAYLCLNPYLRQECPEFRKLVQDMRAMFLTITGARDLMSNMQRVPQSCEEKGDTKDVGALLSKLVMSGAMNDPTQRLKLRRWLMGTPEILTLILTGEGVGDALIWGGSLGAAAAAFKVSTVPDVATRGLMAAVVFFAIRITSLAARYFFLGGAAWQSRLIFIGLQLALLASGATVLGGGNPVWVLALLVVGLAAFFLKQWLSGRQYNVPPFAWDQSVETAAAEQAANTKLAEMEELLEKAPVAGDDLETMTTARLHKLAKEMDLQGRSKMNREELVAAIRAAREVGNEQS